MANNKAMISETPNGWQSKIAGNMRHLLLQKLSRVFLINKETHLPRMAAAK